MPTDQEFLEAIAPDTGSLLDDAAARHGVDPHLAHSVMQVESAGNPNALSPKGAIGPMQLMPDTAKSLGVDPHDPAQNIEGGVKLLKRLTEKYGGDTTKALAAYNAGEGAVDRAGGVPNIPETQQYVQRVNDEYHRLTGTPRQDVSPAFAPGVRGTFKAPTDQDFLNALTPEPDALQAKVTDPSKLPTQAEYDRSHQTFLERARATFNQGVSAVKSGAAALDKAVEPFIPSPLRALPAMADEALPNGIARPLQDVLRPPTQYAEPEPTTTAGKIARGVGGGITHGLEQLTTPGNIGLVVGSEGAGLIPAIGKYLPPAISAVFGPLMFKSASEKIPKFRDAYKKGDWEGAASALTEGLTEGALGALASWHVVSAVRGGGAEVPRGTPETKPADVETKGPIPETPATETKPAAGVSKQPTDEEFLSALYTGPPSTAAESAKTFEQHGKTYAELFEDLSDKEKARASSAAGAANKPGKPVVPEEGTPEGVARAQDARERLSQSLTGQPFADLHNSDRMAIDDLIAQGFGKAVQPGEKAPTEGEVRGPAEVVPMPKPEAATPLSTKTAEAKPLAANGAAAELPRNTGGPKGTDAQPLVTEVIKPGTAPEDFNRGATALKPELAPQGQPSFKVEDGHFVVREENGAPAMRVPLSNPDSVKGASFLLRHMGEDGMADELEKLGGVKAGPEPVKGKEAERAPSVEPAQGKATSISIPGTPATYPAKYAIREAADVKPSHNPFSFGKNPEFEHANDRDYESAGNAARVVEQAQNFNPDYLTTDSPTAEHGAPVIDKGGNVLGGNSRAMTLTRVYEAGGEKADAYRKALTDKAESLGIDPQELARFRNPVLVRELSGAHDAQKAITDFNKKGAAELNPEERAVADGKRMSAETIADLAGRMGESPEGGTLAEALRGEDGAQVINKLVKDGVITQQESNGMVDDRGHLTPEVKSRIAKALVGRLFNSPAEFRQAPVSLRGKLERIAPQVLRVEGRKGWELTRLVREAIGIAEEMRVRKAKAEDLEGQVDVEGKQRSFTPAAKQIAEVLNEGAKNAEYAFRRYANDEMLSRPGAQTPMFEPPTREQAFRDAFGDGPLDVNADRVPKGWESAPGREMPKGAGRVPKVGQGDSNTWVDKLSDRFHGDHASVTPIELTKAEREGADAYLLNGNAMEWLTRAAGHKKDSMVTRISGLHIDGKQLAGLARNMAQKQLEVYHPLRGENLPTSVDYLYQAVANARDAGKSLIFLNGHPGFTDFREGTLEHELGHAAQARVNKGEPHLGASVQEFVNNPLAQRAAKSLERYGRIPRDKMAMEIGVRLMTKGHEHVGPAWRELGLDEQEARDLGAQYLRSLRKEYGNAAPREVAKGLFENAPARSERKVERRERLESLEPTRGSGTPERTGSNVSGDQGEPATAGDRAGATEPGNPRNGGQGSSGTQVLDRIAGENGTEAIIARTSRGFNVAIRDTDAGEFFPESRTFDTLEKARAYAETIKAPEPKGPRLADEEGQGGLFRNDEPKVEKGFTRLYRGQEAPGQGGGVPEWLKGNPKFEGIKDAAGRWFAADRENADWYTSEAKAAGKKTETHYVDVPTSDLSKYSVNNIPEAKKFSARPDEEYFLPREIADQKKPLESDTAKANQRDTDALTKQRLEAQLKAPITREEQLKKLKRDKTERQGGLFSGPADEQQQGSLFDASVVGAGERRPNETLSDWRSRMEEHVGKLSTSDAVRLYKQAGDFLSDESGHIDYGRIVEKYREGKLFKSMYDVLRPLGSRVADEGDGAGKDLMKLIRRAGDKGEVHAGQMLARLSDARINSLDRGQRAELLDTLEGRAKSKDPRVLEVAKVMRGITDELAGVAAATGVEVRTKTGRRPFAQLEDYFPHVLRNAEALGKDPVRRDVIDNIVRQGIKPNAKEAGAFVDDWVNYLQSGKRADSLLQHLVDSGQATDKAEALAKLQRFRSNIQRHGSLEYSRELNLPFYDPDPVRVIPFAAATGAKRLAQIAEFGQDHQRINREILKISEAGGNPDFVRKSVDNMLGVISEGDTAEARVSRFLRATQTLKLGLSAIPNATQGVLNSMLKADAPTVAAGFVSALSKRGRRLAIESGAAIEPVLAEAHKELGGGRMVDRYLKMTGFSQTEQFNRAVSANVGAKWANKNLEQLISKPTDKGARARLEELGIDADAAIKRGSLTQEDRLMAAKKFSDITQFRTRPEDLPAFASTPFGRVAFQFKTFAYNQARLIAKETVGEIKAGRVGRGLRTAFVVATLFPAAGELVRLLRNGITGRDQEFEDDWAHYLFSLSSAGTLGILSDAWQAAESKRGTEFLAGPAATDAGRLAAILANPDMDTEDKLDALKKYTVQRYSGPARRLFEDQ